MMVHLKLYKSLAQYPIDSECLSLTVFTQFSILRIWKNTNHLLPNLEIDLPNHSIRQILTNYQNMKWIKSLPNTERKDRMVDVLFNTSPAFRDIPKTQTSGWTRSNWGMPLRYWTFGERARKVLCHTLNELAIPLGKWSQHIRSQMAKATHTHHQKNPIKLRHQGDIFLSSNLTPVQ